MSFLTILFHTENSQQFPQEAGLIAGRYRNRDHFGLGQEPTLHSFLELLLHQLNREPAVLQVYFRLLFFDYTP